MNIKVLLKYFLKDLYIKNGIQELALKIEMFRPVYVTHEIATLYYKQFNA